MSFYLKYRPKTLDDLVGQDHITDILRAQATAGKFSQNYLLCGSRGTGKTSTARLIAKLVNATTKDKQGLPDIANDPIAQQIDSSKTLDIIEIDAASHTGVDNVREEIIEKAPYPPHQLSKKVYIIDEVHMLSKWAFNALLKIMEEPPEYVMFILATTELHKVPDTIVSRSQLFMYKRIQLPELVTRLEYIATQENIPYTTAGLAMVAKAAAGGMRDAIKYLEQISLLGEVNEEHVARYLWVVTDETLRIRFDAIIQQDTTTLYTQIDQLIEKNADFSQFTKALALYADEHFQENPIGAAQVIHLTTTILEKQRVFPFIHILYKQACAQRGVTNENAQTSTAQNSENTSTDTPTETVANSSAETTANTPTESTATNDNTTKLLQQLAQKAEKKMVQVALTKSAHMSKIDGDIAHIIILQEQYYTLVSKPQQTKDLEEKLSDIRGEKTHIQRTYMSKEDFLLQ